MVKMVKMVTGRRVVRHGVPDQHSDDESCDSDDESCDSDDESSDSDDESSDSDDESSGRQW